jgi:hypothetical protein
LREREREEWERERGTLILERRQNGEAFEEYHQYKIVRGNLIKGNVSKETLSRMV